MARLIDRFTSQGLVHLEHSRACLAAEPLWQQDFVTPKASMFYVLYENPAWAGGR
jgi:hypothetical protein